ncbi:UxaA family hydrolase [Maritalea sp.]|uniref:UxaA family hydrolase n=1 Tax=Maritalea sp. TaxID=2003361 RepID=UPI003EF65AF5
MNDGADQGQKNALDKRLLLLDAADNVLGVARPIRAGDAVLIEGVEATLDRNAGIGFKLARRSIHKGEHVVKYGAVIGLASADIEVGQLVHVHNTQSQYMANTVTTGAPRETQS